MHTSRGADTFADLALLNTGALSGGRLHPDQIAGIEFLLNTQRALLADDPGRGKTAQMIGWLAHFKACGDLAPSSGNQALVAVPTASLGHQTAEAFRELCPSLVVTDWTGGTSKARTLPASDVLVVTYALLRQRVDDFAAARFRFLVGDEASAVKGTGPVHEAFRRLAITSSRVVMLTATPYETDAFELRAILTAAGIDMGSEEQWGKILYFYKDKGDGTFKWQGLKPAAPIILQHWMNPYSLRREGPLPGIRYPVPVGPAYRLVQPTAAQLHKLDRADSVRKWSPFKAHQMAKAASALVGEGHAQHSSKATALTGWLLNRPDVRKAIVYSESTRTLDHLGQLLAANGISALRIDGSSTKAKRLDRVEQFRDDPSIGVLLGTSVLSRGLNLQFCRVILSHDGFDNPAQMAQLEGRVCRPGSPHETYEFVTFLLDHHHDLKRRLRATRRAGEASKITPDNSKHHTANR